MDADEKLIALKKAYADIILNVSKEAAMRVMSSERRAKQYQHELKVGKEEALRMLMRLKQMMDSKISHVEIASQNQQKKIEELEAQLDEAEDIVKDLREELGEARDELERLKKDNFQHSNEPTNTFSIEMETGILDSYKSNKFLHPNSQENLSNLTLPNPSHQIECCNSQIVCTCCSYTRNRDLPSIILRGKEPGLYRNGWTQRICACERDISDKELCLSGEADKVNDENNSREQSREQDESKDINKAPAAAETLTELEQKLLTGNELSNFQSFPRKRKRATRARKTVTPLSGKHVPVLVKETTPMLSQVNIATRAHLGFESTSKKETNLVETFGGITLRKDEELKDKMVLFEDETRLAESLSSPDCKIAVEKIDVPSNGLEPNPSNATKGLDSPLVGQRVIKFTFQRRRKRESLNGTKMNFMLGTEKETGVKQNGDHKPEKSEITKESSRDSRRLAQVARQLISLSEKKWWH